MSYVLDGIETAMEEQDWGTFRAINCPCGWSYQRKVDNAGRAALRFHYTHCPKAKPLVDYVEGYGVIRNAANTTPDSETNEPEPER